jgi:hypothetical protein
MMPRERSPCGSGDSRSRSCWTAMGTVKPVGPTLTAGPTAVTDHRHAGISHAFHEVAGEVTVARVPDPLTVGLVEGGPPLMGAVQGITHRGPTFWIVVVERHTSQGTVGPVSAVAHGPISAGLWISRWSRPTGGRACRRRWRWSRRAVARVDAEWRQARRQPDAAPRATSRSGRRRGRLSPRLRGGSGR